LCSLCVPCGKIEPQSTQGIHKGHKEENEPLLTVCGIFYVVFGFFQDGGLAHVRFAKLALGLVPFTECGE
jgi:hypothetical protein